MAPTQRVYHVDELKTNTTLKIDIKYYLSQQIHPVIMRLCAPLENIDAKMIADHLGYIIALVKILGNNNYDFFVLIGLDSTQYQNKTSNSAYSNSVEENTLDLDDSTRFNNCDQ